MIDFEVPSLQGYNTSNARRLASEIKELRNFDDIRRWDKQATEETERIRSAIESIEHKIQQLSQDLEQAEKTHGTKPLLARLFSSRGEEKKLRVEQTQLSDEKSKLEKLNSSIQATIDFTPDSSEDLKELLKKIRVLKKEFQFEKKTVNAGISQIRVMARQKTAGVTPGKYGKRARQGIRLAKEEGIMSLENLKASLERQIISLDQEVAWLERFK